MSTTMVGNWPACFPDTALFLTDPDL